MADHVEINVPDRPVTTRSPTDALRLIVTTLVTLVTVLLVLAFPETMGRLVEDLAAAFDGSGGAAPEVAGFVVAVIVVASPVILFVFFVREREFGRVAIIGLAAVIGAVISTTIIQWLLRAIGIDQAQASTGAVVTASAYYPYVGAMTAAVTAAHPWLPRRWQRAAWWAIVALVLIRVLLASALPAELILSISIGVASGAGVLFALGSPNRRPTGHQIVDTLKRSGVDVARIDAANVDARGSTPYFIETTDGRRIFAKTLSTDERSADLMFRVYRRLSLKNVGDEPAFSSLRRAVEHEALMSYSATAAGVRTPPLVAVGRIGDEDYSMLLAFEAIDGRSLDDVDDEQTATSALAGVWRQIAILREHGIAHRDLRLANVFLADDNEPWIIDFGFSELAASPLLLENDVAELLASSALLVGPERAVRAAVDVLGPETVAGAAGRIQPPALSGATRTAIKEDGTGLDRRLRSEIESTTGLPIPRLDSVTRVPVRRRG